MARRLTGTLKLPDTSVASNVTIRVIAKRTEGTAIVKGVSAEFMTDAGGVYDVTVEAGFYAVTAELNGHVVVLGEMVVEDSDTTDTTLNALISVGNSTADPTSIALQTLLTNAQAAADAAAVSAAGAAADAASIDPVRFHLVAEAEYFGRVEQNKHSYPGSGFVEWGKNTNKSGAQLVNEGMHAKPDIANSLFMSGGVGFVDSVSRTEYPIVNVAGNEIVLNLINLSSPDSNSRNTINFPQAPDGKKTYNKITGVVASHVSASAAFLAETADNKVITSRQDLMFLEVWHELVSDKDVVYPLGNVQYGTSTYKGVSLSASIVAQSYSAFGVWDAITTGRGARWSTSTDLQRRIFLSESSNNIYLNKDGELVQVRYRMRVVEGPGDSWGNVNHYAAADQFGYLATFAVVKPKGKLLSISSDTANKAVNESGQFTSRRWVAGLGFGVWQAVAVLADPDAAVAYSGLCFALPLALVQRRNQGAYHPVFNVSGTAPLWDSAGITDSDFWYEPDSKKPSSPADCFDFGGSMTVGNVSPFLGNNGWGGIALGAGSAGRPDACYFDGIYAADVRDLRMSARPLPPQKTGPSCWLQKAVAAALRNYVVQGAPFTRLIERGTVEINGSSSNGLFATAKTHEYSIGDFAVCINQNNIVVASGYISIASASLLGFSSTFTGALNGIVDNNPRTINDVYSIFKVEYVGSGSEVTWIDIIGDPANWPRQATGVIDWDSSQGSQTIKTGQTVEVTALTTGSGVIGNVYLRTGIDSTSVLSEAVYTSALQWLGLGPKADFLASAQGLEGFPLLYSEDGASLIPDGTVKTYKARRKADDDLTSLFSTDNGVSWSTSALMVVGASNSFSNSLAAGRVQLQVYRTDAFVFDVANNSRVLASKLGDGWAGNFNLVDRGGGFVSNLIAKVPTGNHAKAVESLGPASGYQIEPGGKFVAVAVYNPDHKAASLSSASCPFGAKALPYLHADSSGLLYLQVLFKEMDHNGMSWGDDGKFNISDNLSTTTDNNGTAILIGQMRTPLPYFYREA